MKNIYASLILLFLAFPIQSNAQTVLNLAGKPLIGHEIELYSASDDEYDISPGSSGENITWDFSDLPEGNIQNATFLLPDNTPYFTTFGDADFAVLYSDKLQLGTTPVKYEFFKISASGLLKQGEANTQDVVVPFDNMVSLMSYPFTFGSSSSDDFTAEYAVGGVVVTRTGDITSTADAYGEVKLPYGTVEDVLRVKHEISYEEVTSSGITFNVIVESYYWYHANLSYPIMSMIFEKVGGSSSTVARLSFAKSEAVPFKTDIDVGGINEAFAASIQLQNYPNPTTDFSLIKYNLASPAVVSVNLYNAMGQVVKTLVKEEMQSGPQRLVTDFTDLARGSYFVEMLIDGERAVRTIIVQ